MDKKGYYEVRREIESVCKISVTKKMKANELIKKEDDPEMDMTTDKTTDEDELECNISESEVESESAGDGSDKPDETSLCSDVASWCVEFGISEAAGNGLLKILKKYHPNLPKNIKTLKKTPSEDPKSKNILAIGNGQYLYLGLRTKIEKFLAINNIRESVLEFDVGIDGVPLTKSSNSQLWPILGNIIPYKEVFLIGIFHGYKKPTCANGFMQPFIDEMKDLTDNPITYKGKFVRVKIRSFICDSPARSFILGVKSHSGYNSCTKCTIRGIYYQHKVCFPGTENSLRTDQDFKEKRHLDHHIRFDVALETLNIGCVTNFPIDYMHCVLLGVTRQVLQCLVKKRKQTFSLKKEAIEAINNNLRCVRKCLPSDFQRKQRTLQEMDHWKATELRMFLCYTGVLVLKDNLNETYYSHFLLLVCAVRILSHPEDCHTNNNCASALIIEFVQQFSELYGTENMSYNVHSLLHLADDVKKFGHLDGYSAFKFENFMQKMKKMVRKPSFPIQQIQNRLKENDCFQEAKAEQMYSELFNMSSMYPNNYCIVNNGVFKIMQLYNDIVKGHFILNLKNFFEYPVPSSNFSIFSCNEEILSEDLKTLKIIEIKNKVIMATASEDDIQTQYSDLLEFCDNETENYVCNQKIKPHTSTQKTMGEKKFYYQNNNKASNSKQNRKTEENDVIIGTSRQQNTEKASTDSDSSEYSQSPKKPTVSTQDLIVQNNNLLKASLRELKYLRREQKCMRRELDELRTMSSNNGKINSRSSCSLNIPRPTAESFLELEQVVKTENGESALRGILNGIPDVSLEKYVRGSLKAILSDKAACNFSWFGHNNNIPVNAFHIINIIKECTMDKFPNARASDAIAVAKKWFQYAKDRQRKLIKK